LRAAQWLTVVALPGQEANVRGFSAPSLIVIDEAARLPDLGDLMLLSTPFGERGFSWKEWTRGGGRWMRVQGLATNCPRISAEVLEEERTAQSAEWFAQEYMCSFVGLENQALRTEWLTAAVAAGLGVQELQFKMKGGTL